MSLLDLLNDPLPVETTIKPENGQIWVNDHNGLECKILNTTDRGIEVLLDISCYRITGKIGSKKFEEFYVDYFYANFTYKRG